MNYRFSREEESFRAEVREFLEDYRDLDGFFGQDQKWDRVKPMFLGMGERGWLALSWPKAHGGLDRDSSIGFFMSDHERPGTPPVLTVTDVLEPFADLERCRTPDAQVTKNGQSDNDASPESAGN